MGMPPDHEHGEAVLARAGVGPWGLCSPATAFCKVGRPSSWPWVPVGSSALEQRWEREPLTAWPSLWCLVLLMLRDSSHSAVAKALSGKDSRQCSWAVPTSDQSRVHPQFACALPALTFTAGTLGMEPVAKAFVPTGAPPRPECGPAQPGEAEDLPGKPQLG